MSTCGSSLDIASTACSIEGDGGRFDPIFAYALVTDEEGEIAMADFPDKWSKLASRELKDRGLESLVWHAPEGFDVRPLYTAADLSEIEGTDTLPGLAPFTRGVRATMYAGRPWTIRQYAGFSTAEESNAFYRKNLAAGQIGIALAFYPAPHPV